MSAETVRPFDFGIGFKTFGERIAGEQADRLARRAGRLSFGVSFLDAALNGIGRNDLIILGARTGAGKTELSTLIALANARAGKRVHYFALEAEEREIERRAKYKLLVQLAMGTEIGQRAWRRFNYMAWLDGDIEELFTRVQERAEEMLSTWYGSTLNTFYRIRNFNVETLERNILAIQDATDLVIVDHLHYIDTDDPNENRGYKAIVKKIRDVVLSIGKPVIVVAHVRKAERKSPPLVPDLDDFHGTSDVPKIATKAIMLAPAFNQTPLRPRVWPTYMRPAKCRPDGSRTRYCGLVDFDPMSANYDSPFRIGKLSTTGEEWTETNRSDWPNWAEEGSNANG